MDAAALKVHFVKSISCLQPLQVCFLLNSSEKISTSFPQVGHLHMKDFRPLNCSNPGQCCGVLIATSHLYYKRSTTNDPFRFMDFRSSFFVHCPSLFFQLLQCI